MNTEPVRYSYCDKNRKKPPPTPRSRKPWPPVRRWPINLLPSDYSLSFPTPSSLQSTDKTIFPPEDR